MTENQSTTYYQLPYCGPMPPNTRGPPEYTNSPYKSPMPQQIIISNGTVPVQHLFNVGRSTSHGLCFLICLLTSGLSIPCWIYGCITDNEN
jgi:hypothetical protein